MRRTWAPCGETPIHYSWERQDRNSASAGIKVGPDFTEPQVFLELWMQNIKAEQIQEFLKAVHQETKRKIIAIMDRWNENRKAARLLSEDGVEGWLLFH